MKKVIVVLFILEMIIISCCIIANVESSQVVLLSGKVIGFEFESQEQIDVDNSTALSNQRIGTLTFVRKDNNQFAALGHAASIGFISDDIKGICYEIELNNVEKNAEKIGHIYGEIDKDREIGEISKNSIYGLFGTAYEISNNDYIEMMTGNKFEVKKEMAEIWIDIMGDGLDKYEINITEIDYFDDCKNIKFEVQDEKLLELTGGLIQGMSGAPIVQNGKIIGVLNNADSINFKEGYAVFVDKVLK